MLARKLDTFEVMKRLMFVAVCVLAFSLTGCAKEEVPFRAMFYNVENLFDTLDQANTQDEEYTPQSRKQWNTQRYHERLNHTADVILAYDTTNLPELVGLCEVENRGVVEDLTELTALKANGYQIVHEDSPDNRGIDVALLYEPAHFEYVSHQTYRIKLPGDRPNTRDILHVTGKVAGGELLHVFVNHWPSRSGGKERSEPKRMLVADKLREVIDGIQAEDKDAKILVMGDLNDHPIDKSVYESLNARHNKKPNNEGELYNLMFEYHEQGTGTHNYKGEWGVLDHLIVSHSLLKAKKGLSCEMDAGKIHKQDFFLYTRKDGSKVPNRTYGGDNYYGGYSDHLPVVVEMVVK